MDDRLRTAARLQGQGNPRLGVLVRALPRVEEPDFSTIKITCYFFTSASPRQTYINGMAKKTITKIEEQTEAGPTYHTIEQTEFEEIVRETLKAQESSLNAMKLISKAIFGWSA